LVIDSDAIKATLPPPKWLSSDAKAEWKRVFPILLDRRILTVADLGSFENYCIAIGQVREMERKLQKEGHVFATESGLKRHPAISIQADAMTRARLLAARAGESSTRSAWRREIAHSRFADV
jgi:P27 family predicted phage terminase small subunit